MWLHKTAISKRIKLKGPGWSRLRANSRFTNPPWFLRFYGVFKEICSKMLEDMLNLWCTPSHHTHPGKALWAASKAPIEAVPPLSITVLIYYQTLTWDSTWFHNWMIAHRIWSRILISPFPQKHDQRMNRWMFQPSYLSGNSLLVINRYD